jgi:hypothetical protein
MRLQRRRLLALLPATLAGCGGLGDGGSGEGRRVSPTSTAATPSGPPVDPQSISVGNPRPDAAFVTVAVERGGETVFVGSRELVPGERHTTGAVVSSGGTYDVTVETADWRRATYRWTVADGFDGLSVTLGDGIEFLRTVRCRPDCALASAGEGIDDPLIGDGTARWYAPARVVLTNPGSPTEATLTVELDQRTLVDYRYRVDRETRVVVPITYRSGTYRVAVETSAGRVTGDWRVPEEPSRVVDLTTLQTGCGPANTELRVENADDRPHTVQVAVDRDGWVLFTERYELDPGERRTTVPVSVSGRYDVRLQVDGGEQVTRTWWACPPRGPVTVVVDATGTVTLRQSAP